MLDANRPPQRHHLLWACLTIRHRMVAASHQRLDQVGQGAAGVLERASGFHTDASIIRFDLTDVSRHHPAEQLPEHPVDVFLLSRTTIF